MAKITGADSKEEEKDIGLYAAGFQPLTLSDFPGRTASIVFVQGCNFACPFCHNKELIPIPFHFREKEPSGDKFAAPFPDFHANLQRIDAYLEGRKHLLDGVVVTGGEPTMQPGILDFAGYLKKLGYAVKIDTNGSLPAVVKSLLDEDLVDFIALDIKAPWDKYPLCCGRAEAADAVRETMELTASRAPEYVFRTTFFPEVLSLEDIERIKNGLPHRSRYIIQKGTYGKKVNQKKS